MVMPAVKAVWEAWKIFARKFGDFQARVLLTFLYFVVFAPFALALKLGSDPLAIKAGISRGWQRKGEGQGAPLERARRQF